MEIFYKKIFLLTSSALLYAGAYIFNQNYWWASFIFLIPLYYSVITDTIKPKDGFLWGLLSLGLHVFGIFRAINYQAEGSLILCSLPILAMLFYSGLLGLLFFSVTIFLIKITNVNKYPAIKLLIWAITTTGYFFMLCDFSFLPLGLRQGYCFLSPLLPLIHFPALLSLLPLIGKNWLLFFLCLSQAALIYIFYEQPFLIKILLVLCIFSPWLISLMYVPKALSAPSWLNQVLVMPWRFKVPEQDIGKALQEQLHKSIVRYPEKRLVILPEGAIHPSDLQKVGPVCFEWHEQPLAIVVGGTTWSDQKRFNTVYWLKNGCIHDIYYKRHAMMLIEYLAPFADCALLRKLYFSKIIPMSISENPHVAWELLPNINFVPYICSELFFSKKPDDTFASTILALCGDHWALDTYIKELMYMAARFKAIEWQRDIIYISYFFAQYCTKEGTTFALDRLHTAI